MSRRGWSMAEAVVATSLAVVMVSTVGGEVLRQHRELSLARARGQVNAALRSAAERVRAGLVPLPPPGEERALPTEQGAAADVRVTIALSPGPLDPRLLPQAELAPVLLCATWQGAPLGEVRRRELLVLVAVGGER